MNYLGVILLLTLTSLLSAGSENRVRAHSVHKAIQKILETEKKEFSVMEEFHSAIASGKVIGQARSMYSLYKSLEGIESHVIAIGGMLRYEIAEYYGLNFASVIVMTKDIELFSKNIQYYNNELSGDEHRYIELSEVYINYNYDGLSFCIGRQIIDTPLADSDDVRMIANSFEAYTAFYNTDSFSFMLGHFDRWQGTDADLNEGWIKTGEDGVTYTGALFTNKLLDIAVWYYDFSNPSKKDLQEGSLAVANRSFYSDISAHVNFNKDVFLHFNAQYLLQKGYDDSLIEANIYGLMGEVVYKKFGMRLAYNKAQKKANKESFVGYGGGTLYTSMDAATLDVITKDRSAYATVGILSYHLNRFKFLYAYGIFKGDSDSNGLKAKIEEHNFGVKYMYNNFITLGAIYVTDRNKDEPQSLEFNNDNFRLMFAYNF